MAVKVVLQHNQSSIFIIQYIISNTIPRFKLRNMLFISTKFLISFKHSQQNSDKTSSLYLFLKKHGKIILKDKLIEHHNSICFILHNQATTKKKPNFKFVICLFFPCFLENQTNCIQKFIFASNQWKLINKDISLQILGCAEQQCPGISTIPPYWLGNHPSCSHNNP